MLSLINPVRPKTGRYNDRSISDISEENYRNSLFLFSIFSFFLDSRSINLQKKKFPFIAIRDYKITRDSIVIGKFD